MARAGRLATFVALTLLLLAALPLLPRLAQDPAYHAFADRRPCVGVPSCLNVVSNLPFVLVGLLGLVSLGWARPGASGFADPRERRPYRVFFLGIALTGLGSAYYHLAPGDARLVWDRLPMTLTFASLLAAVVAERIALRAGVALLWPLAGLGAASVLYWDATERAGMGDLRPYALAQLYPVIAIPVLMGLFPARYTRGGDLLLAAGLYAVAKGAEALDAPILALGQVVSGHTVKHVVAAAAAWWLLRMLERRVRAGAG
jgi:hypothetical protein